MAQGSFGEVGDENSFVVHDEGETDPVPNLPENVANHRIQQELAELVLDRRDGFALEAWIVGLVFLSPKRPDKRIAHLIDDPASIVGVGEESIYPEQGGVGAFEQRGKRVVEDVLQARSPRIAPNAFERADDAGGNKVLFIRRNICE